MMTGLSADLADLEARRAQSWDLLTAPGGRIGQDESGDRVHAEGAAVDGCDVEDGVERLEEARSSAAASGR